jgi:hypothetical protein
VLLGIGYRPHLHYLSGLGVLEETGNKPHGEDRAWSWSPEQIANRIVSDFPDDESMRISHEAIYQALYIEGRGALERGMCPAM